MGKFDFWFMFRSIIFSIAFSIGYTIACLGMLYVINTTFNIRIQDNTLLSVLFFINTILFLIPTYNVVISFLCDSNNDENILDN